MSQHIDIPQNLRAVKKIVSTQIQECNCIPLQHYPLYEDKSLLLSCFYLGEEYHALISCYGIKTDYMSKKLKLLAVDNY